MADDVDHVPVWVADEEPADAPRLVGHWMNDLVAAALRFGVGLILERYPARSSHQTGAVAASTSSVDTLGWIQRHDPSQLLSTDSALGVHRTLA
jgi:hypothetical protein